MQIPNFTRCLICNNELRSYIANAKRKYCCNYAAGHKFEFCAGKWIEIAYYDLNTVLMIYEYDEWDYRLFYVNGNIIAKGTNASELFDLTNVQQIKETMQTLDLYS